MYDSTTHVPIQELCYFSPPRVDHKHTEYTNESTPWPPWPCQQQPRPIASAGFAKANRLFKITSPSQSELL